VTPETQRWLVTWQLLGSPDELPVSLLLSVPEALMLGPKPQLPVLVSRDLNADSLWCGITQTPSNRWRWYVSAPRGDGSLFGDVADFSSACQRLRVELARRGIEVPE